MRTRVLALTFVLAPVLGRAPAFAQAPEPFAGACKDTVTWLASDRLPDGTPPRARLLETWLQRSDLDEELLDPAGIAALNVRNTLTAGAWRDPLAEPGPAFDDVDRELVDRLSHIDERVQSGEYQLGPTPDSDPRAPLEPSRYQAAWAAVRPRIEASLPPDPSRLGGTLQALVEPADLRCIPLAAGLYRGRIDRAFDRNQCSRLPPGDLVRVLRQTRDGWLYVQAGHGVGWLESPLLSPPLSPAEARTLRERPRLTAVDDLVPATTAHGDLSFLRFGSAFPLVSESETFYQILIPTHRGWDDAFVAKSPALRPGVLPLTRRNVFTLAFQRLGDPYSWGGLGGFRDCSGLLLDTMATFDLRLGRNSSVQAQAGQTLEVGTLSEADKLEAIRRADRQGIVFLYMPGHIMLYLGELDGRPYALSAISEYLLPCPAGASPALGPDAAPPHRTVRIDRIDVTDLERGRGTKRTAFLQRIERLAVFGRAP